MPHHLALQILVFLKASFRPLIALSLGCGFLWYGLSFDEMPFSKREPIGYYSFHIAGAILIASGFGGFAYNLAKFYVPIVTNKKLTDAGDETFDADAARERYLANRNNSETE